MDYIIKVTEEGIVIPNNIPKGEYKLVCMTETEKEKELSGRIGLSYIMDNYQVYTSDGKKDPLFARAIRRLQRAGYGYINELNCMHIEDVECYFGYGFKSEVVTIALCNKFGVDIKYPEEKYGKAVAEYEKRIEEIV